MDILFSKDKVSYTHEDIEKLCKLVCEDKNIDYKEYKLKLNTVMIYNTDDIFSYLILFEDLKKYCFKYGVDLMGNVDLNKDRIMDKTGTMFYTKDILELGYAIAAYYNMRFLEYKRDSNDRVYYHLGNGKEKYSCSLMIRYFGKHKADYMGYLAKGEKAKEGYIPEWFSAEGELLYRFKYKKS